MHVIHKLSAFLSVYYFTFQSLGPHFYEQKRFYSLKLIKLTIFMLNQNSNGQLKILPIRKINKDINAYRKHRLHLVGHLT